MLAATNRNLSEAVREGRLRMDLYYRLLVFPVDVPPLRERREDIPGLAAHFVGLLARQFGRRVKRISEATMRQLMAYDWPGNIRELENFLARAVVLSPGEVLNAPLDLTAGHGVPEAAPAQSLPAVARGRGTPSHRRRPDYHELGGGGPEGRGRNPPDEPQHLAQPDEAAGHPPAGLS